MKKFKMFAKKFTLLIISAIILCALYYAIKHSTDLFQGFRVRKNVVLITLDGLRADHLSCFGYERKTSPNIDSLAKKGVRFDQIITSGCSTKVALTSLFTSLDYKDHKTINTKGSLSEDFTTLAEVFQDNGYATAGFTGSIIIQKSYNYDQGFSIYEDFTQSWEDLKYISSNLVMEKLFQWLDRFDRGKPFFIYCHFEEPHPPWQHASPWLTEEEEDVRFFNKGCTYLPKKEEVEQVTASKIINLTAKYDGAIYNTDKQIGMLIDKLRSTGELKNTIIAIGTDHGIELLEHGTATHGHCPYDEVARVPYIIYS